MRSDKCYYYAPEYNLDRFEIAQGSFRILLTICNLIIEGYIANFHLNARTSAVVRKGVFTLVSMRMGDGVIRTSTTKSLTPIRSKKEELEKGWKRGEIAAGERAEFRGMDAVHVVPLIWLEMRILYFCLLYTVNYIVNKLLRIT